jgi:cellulose synthase/poly-beta-1,6-N-acetylglucosamine synthase-like glycosyltransferase
MEIVDHDFYTSFYQDLKHMTPRESRKHYLRYGRKEKRICNKKMMIGFQKKTTNQIEKEYENSCQKSFKKKEKLINILIRTSNRPEYFKTCIESVLKQKYENYNVYICFDKMESLSYLTHFKNNEKIEYFPVYKKSKEKYKFNLYCNDLLDKVTDGYVIFLDDDDKFCHNNVLKILNDVIDEQTLVIWKFFRPDKLIYPTNIKKIILGEISACAFSGHIKSYENCRWWDKRNGDYNFITQVIDKNNPKIKILDY